MRPSILASSISAILIIIVAIMLFNNYKSFDIYQIAILLSLISIYLGVHSIHHYYEEIYFDFNPLVGKWKINDDVVVK